MNGNTVITLRIPRDLVEKLDDHAEENKRSRNYIVIEALEARFNPPVKAAAKKPRQKKVEVPQ